MANWIFSGLIIDSVLALLFLICVVLFTNVMNKNPQETKP
jgi:hypothetical protein